MALAGTRKNGTDSPWDDKNILEQKIVTDYILKLLKSEGLGAQVYDPHTRVAGAIEHICSEIVSEIPENFTHQSLTNLLKKLSPTPALCGEPKSEALQLIQTSETFDRGFYGGFCGIYKSPSDFCFNVNIRCLCATENRYCLFAGGGITKDSEIDSEWKETEIKLKTILNVIDNNL